MLKILHAPVNIGNHPWVLSRNERKFGCLSDLVINYSTWLGYPADKVLGTYGEKNFLKKLKKIFFALQSPFRYDVIHYYFGKSILSYDNPPKNPSFDFLDLKLAKKLGKKIFFTLQGCDVRLASESSTRNLFTPCGENKCSAYQVCVSTLDQRRKNFIKNILPLADQIFYLNPELGHYLPKSLFLPYANMEVNNFTKIPPNIKRTPKIVHAPSDATIKGTDLILKALESLKANYEFELILVQNKSHQEAMEIYRDADLVIDQVLCGWYGGFAVEMMAMGKPVMCYIRKEDLNFIPKKMSYDLPILNIHPATLEKDIASFLDRKEEWNKWSDSSVEFVRKWHNPAIIAEILVEAYQQDAPYEFLKEKFNQ
ncbi:MAG: glycosyltransferase [Candidatus Paracaedimonas acanthamoebae]|uniref:Glycosyltransferase n=1 Tax=Candidatus Paracaedimonas acanthamoebae TaxID=244581 RepID=A0A8J7PVJ7_9PROT|nr:glycosyltransferase [Candidatus Paracaedimonas acanthamoebae]